MIMPRPRPPHLQLQITRHGKTVWYVRIGKGARIRIRFEFGTPEFDAEYQAALAGSPLLSPKDNSTSQGTLTWLIDRYRETSVWAGLSPATRRQRENILRHVLEKSGSTAFVEINPASINAGLENRAATPSQARHFLNAMRGVFRWALKAGHVKINPTAGVDGPKCKTGTGFMAWTEEHVQAYERRWPIGTRQRVWLDVLLYTGLRRGDVVRLGRQHVRNGVATIKTEKSGFKVEVTLPILPVLAVTLAAGPVGDLTFIVGKGSQPLTKESFGNLFKDACRAAGVPGSAHGVRKVAATRAANAGATVAQLEAIFGWSGGGMASLYTRSADRRRLSKEAMHKLATE
jgi:integrase